MKVAYLVKVSANENSNRFYRMVQTGDCFVVETGRIGATPVPSKKPMKFWESVYNRKIAEGFEDRTVFTNVKVDKTANAQYKEIEDKNVAELISSLQRYANRVLKESYNISYEEVNQKMIDAAQDIIFELSECQKDVAHSVELLEELFVIIPRRMKNVKEMLPQTVDDISDIIQREQDILDVMAAKVSQTKKTSTDKKPTHTILDVLGMDVRCCDDDENAQIKRHMTTESAGLFKRAFRVINNNTEKQFWNYFNDNGMNEENVHYYYHGSKNGNYFGLLTEGPKLNPNASITGKMFGYGIYFANRAKKSINYTSLSGSYWAKGSSRKAYLLVYKVCYKKPKHLSVWTSSCTTYNSKNLGPYDAVYAHKGPVLYNDEIVVYNEAQMTIQYIIELSQ